MRGNEYQKLAERVQTDDWELIITMLTLLKNGILKIIDDED